MTNIPNNSSFGLAVFTGLTLTDVVAEEDVDVAGLIEGSNGPDGL